MSPGAYCRTKGGVISGQVRTEPPGVVELRQRAKEQSEVAAKELATDFDK